MDKQDKTPMVLRREYLGWSQEELARNANVGTQTARNGERRTHPPLPLANSVALYESLGCEPLPEEFKRMFFLEDKSTKKV